MIKTLSAVVVALVLGVGLTGCGSEAPSEASGGTGITVPEVVGMSYHEASLELGDVGLGIDHTEVVHGTSLSIIEGSIITEQEPSAGEKVKPLSVVLVTIPTRASAAEPVEPSAVASPEPEVIETEAPADDGSGKKLVAAVTASLKEAFGVDKFAEAQDLDPSFWIGYITDIASAGDGSIIVILDISTDDAYGYGFDGASNAIMSLVGQENDDLQGVIVKTSEGDVLGDTVRSDIPILN